MTHKHERWMLDFGLTENGAYSWIRMPALTWTAVLRQLKYLQSTKFHNACHRKAELDWSSIRIQKETDLDELVDKDGNLVKWSNNEPVCNLREYLFDDRYEYTRQAFLSGEFDPMEEWYKNLEDHLYSLEEFKDFYPELDWEVLEEVA